MLDFIRIGCAVPAVQIADTVKNTRDICDYITAADEKCCDIVVFPELALTGYTCADLFFQENLLQTALKGIDAIAIHSAQYPAVTAVVGAPMVIAGQMAQGITEITDIHHIERGYENLIQKLEKIGTRIKLVEE